AGGFAGPQLRAVASAETAGSEEEDPVPFASTKGWPFIRSNPVIRPNRGPRPVGKYPARFPAGQRPPAERIRPRPPLRGLLPTTKTPPAGPRTSTAPLTLRVIGVLADLLGAGHGRSKLRIYFRPNAPIRAT